jgi:(p)ppGpp synthase/HD superfamily hydrolase
LIDIAKKIAKKAHAGQTDRAGVDYIKHVQAVAKGVSGKAEIVAWLHDVLEDSHFTESDLKKAGISDEILKAVIAITKIEGEDYNSYLKRVKANKLARIVKISDMKHNMDLSRLKTVKDADIKRRAKYKKAIEFMG